VRRIPVPVWFAGIPAALVVLAGMILSYNALAVLALSAGIDPVLSWAYPGVIDGVIITGSVAAYVLRRARLRIRLYLWSLIGVAVGLSIVGNATHALTHGGLMTLPPLAAAAVSAVPPASLAAALHVIVVLWRALGNAQPDVSDVAQEVEPVVLAETHTVVAHEEAPNGRQIARRNDTRRRDNRRRVARLVRARPDVSASEAAKRLGVSRSTASRLLTEVRKP
jgi:hypothetical protein